MDQGWVTLASLAHRKRKRTKNKEFRKEIILLSRDFQHYFKTMRGGLLRYGWNPYYSYDDEISIYEDDDCIEQWSRVVIASLWAGAVVSLEIFVCFGRYTPCGKRHTQASLPPPTTTRWMVKSLLRILLVCWNTFSLKN